jgi:HMG-box domain
MLESRTIADALVEKNDEGEEVKVASADDVKAAPVKTSKRKKWKKPKDKPKRPLSAYNLFFQYERERLLHGDPEPEVAETIDVNQDSEAGQKSDGRIGFAALAKEVASKWKRLEPHQKESFERDAEKEKERYRVELQEWKTNQSKREQEAEDWTARREEVIRSLSSITHEQERTEHALQAAIAMQPSFSDTGNLPQGYLERTINDAFINELSSHQMNQYDQMLLNESYNQQLMRQQERSISLAAMPQESMLRGFQESPMDLYTRMIYAGTSDVTAANAMHSYLSAQYAAAGLSLGMPTDLLVGESHLPMGSVRNDSRLSSASLAHSLLTERLPSGIGAPFGRVLRSSVQEQERGQSEARQQQEQYQSDNDTYFNAMMNSRGGRGNP